MNNPNTSTLRETKVIQITEKLYSFDNGLNETRPDFLPTFPNSKSHSFLTSYRHYKLHNHFNVLSRHYHLRLLISIIHDM